MPQPDNPKTKLESTESNITISDRLVDASINKSVCVPSPAKNKEKLNQNVPVATSQHDKLWRKFHKQNQKITNRIKVFIQGLAVW